MTPETRDWNILTNENNSKQKLITNRRHRQNGCVRVVIGVVVVGIENQAMKCKFLFIF